MNYNSIVIESNNYSCSFCLFLFNIIFQFIFVPYQLQQIWKLLLMLSIFLYLIHEVLWCVDGCLDKQILVIFKVFKYLQIWFFLRSLLLWNFSLYISCKYLIQISCLCQIHHKDKHKINILRLSDLTCLDLLKSYYQIRMHDKSQTLTVFSSHCDAYQWKTMSFGLAGG